MNARITQDWIKKFKSSIKQMEEAGPGDTHPLLYKAQIDAAQSQVRDLRQQLIDHDDRYAQDCHGCELPATDCECDRSGEEDEGW
jgi:hypothetical protein